MILVLPGQMELPLTALTPLLPHMGGCANFARPIVGLALFAFGFLLSCSGIGFGIFAVITAPRGSAFGWIGSVVIDAVVATLLLMPPLTLSSGTQDPAELGLFGLLAVISAVPLTGLLLLLRPAEFRARCRSTRPLLATYLVVALLITPGAVGLVTFGFELAGVQERQVQQTTSGSHAAC